jgi:hypothetical protein
MNCLRGKIEDLHLLSSIYTIESMYVITEIYDIVRNASQDSRAPSPSYRVDLL